MDKRSFHIHKGEVTIVRFISIICWNMWVQTADSLGVEKLATIYTVAPKAKPNEVRGRIPT